jgi:hypothetical protein
MRFSSGYISEISLSFETGSVTPPQLSTWVISPIAEAGISDGGTPSLFINPLSSLKIITDHLEAVNANGRIILNLISMAEMRVGTGHYRRVRTAKAPAGFLDPFHILFPLCRMLVPLAGSEM